MKGDYKIYYNNSQILISSERSQINKNFAKVLSLEKEIEAVFENSAFLFDGITNENIFVLSNYPQDVLLNLMAKVQVIAAGGGIVWNEDNELLMIFRRDKWDLPKGKIEAHEKFMDGAVREVEEETGVKIETVNEIAVLTYHAYKLKGKNCLKETFWYEMKAKPNQKKLVPQTEEDIEEARWVKRGDLKNYQQDSYPLIWDLIAHLAE